MKIEKNLHITTRRYKQMKYCQYLKLIYSLHPHTVSAHFFHRTFALVSIVRIESWQGEWCLELRPPIALLSCISLLYYIHIFIVMEFDACSARYGLTWQSFEMIFGLFTTTQCGFMAPIGRREFRRLTATY